MGLIDNLNLAGARAATAARETVHETQLKRELVEAYAELGRVAYALVEQGQLRDRALAAPAAQVRALEEQLVAVTSRDMQEETA